MVWFNVFEKEFQMSLPDSGLQRRYRLLCNNTVYKLYSITELKT